MQQLSLLLLVFAAHIVLCRAITYPKGTFTPEFIDGTGDWEACHKTTTVFGVYVCVTKSGWSGDKRRLNHIVQVLLQLLDNDGDGNADAPVVLKKMTAASYPYYLYVATEDDADRRLTGTKFHRQRFLSGMPSQGLGQMVGTGESQPNACDAPRWRGADPADRSTWVAKKGVSTGCCKQRDASVEEVHHLITNAAQAIWPAKWDGVKTSTAGIAAFAANGDCGWGYTNNFKSPTGANPKCTGSYAYSDDTCTEECVVTEALYWSSVTYIGGLFTDIRAESTENEWLMTVPDASMKSSVDTSNKNAQTLEEGSKALYDLVSDTTSEKNKWLPAIMPDGVYCVGGGCANPYADDKTICDSERGELDGDSGSVPSMSVSLLVFMMTGIIILI
jgi:hypothetical protein